MNLGKSSLMVFLLLASLTPLRAEVDEHFLGFTIGLGVGMLAPASRDMPEGVTDPALVAHFNVGFTLFRSFGFKAVLSFSPFEWKLPDEVVIEMSHQIITIDAFAVINVADDWRLWPALGYTLDASLTDTVGAGFITAQGLHAEISCGYRLNSIMFVNLAAGYHFTDGFKEIKITKEGIEWGEKPMISYLDLHAGVVFTLN